jgi:hypothetical protein
VCAQRAAAECDATLNYGVLCFLLVCLVTPGQVLPWQLVKAAPLLAWLARCADQLRAVSEPRFDNGFADMGITNTEDDGAEKGNEKKPDDISSNRGGR